jgi:hypothetical protein
MHYRLPADQLSHQQPDIEASGVNHIVVFLRTGNAALPTKRALRRTGTKDFERGLRLKLRIEHYTSNRETKDFIIEQARLMAPEARRKSGVWYRLNRWREEQITSGARPTYGDLVRQYILLNKMPRFERIRMSSRSSTSPRTMRRGSGRTRSAS